MPDLFALLLWGSSAGLENILAGKRDYSHAPPSVTETPLQGRLSRRAASNIPWLPANGCRYRVGGYTTVVSHVVDNRKQLLARVNRLIGQMQALKREIEGAKSDDECRTIMQQLSSIRGAMNGLSMLFLEEHVKKHIARGASAQERDLAADDLLAALKSFRT